MPRNPQVSQGKRPYLREMRQERQGPRVSHSLSCGASAMPFSQTTQAARSRPTIRGQFFEETKCEFH